MFSSISSASKGYGALVQDNEFTDWTGSSAIGSVYKEDKILVENNKIYSPRASSTYSGIGTTLGIALKADNDFATIRGNSVIMNKGYLIAGLNAAYYQSDYSEICFNLLVGIESMYDEFDSASGFQGLTKIWRNTYISKLGILNESGPYEVANNIIINDGVISTRGMTALSPNRVSYSPTHIYSNFATEIDNLNGSEVNLFVDSADEYKLISEQSAYVGSRGWQLSDGLTPMELSESTIGAPNFPTGLSIF